MEITLLNETSVTYKTVLRVDFQEIHLMILQKVDGSLYGPKYNGGICFQFPFFLQKFFMKRRSISFFEMLMGRVDPVQVATSNFSSKPKIGKFSLMNWSEDPDPYEIMVDERKIYELQQAPVIWRTISF